MAQVGAAAASVHVEMGPQEGFWAWPSHPCLQECLEPVGADGHLPCSGQRRAGAPRSSWPPCPGRWTQSLGSAHAPVRKIVACLCAPPPPGSQLGGPPRPPGPAHARGQLTPRARADPGLADTPGPQPPLCVGASPPFHTAASGVQQRSRLTGGLPGGGAALGWLEGLTGPHLFPDLPLPRQRAQNLPRRQRGNGFRLQRFFLEKEPT